METFQRRAVVVKLSSTGTISDLVGSEGVECPGQLLCATKSAWPVARVPTWLTWDLLERTAPSGYEMADLGTACIAFLALQSPSPVPSLS